VSVNHASLVKEANDIVEVIGEYVALRRQGRTYKGLCPFHNDHHPSFDVDPVRQRFRCWSCGKFGDVITFIQEREHCDFRAALEQLARRANITLPRGPSPEESESRAKMLDLMKWAEHEFARFLAEAPGGEAARAYLDERGLTEQTVEKYGLGFAPNANDWLTQRARKANWPDELLVRLGLSGQREGDSALYDRFRDRVIFPIRDVRGRTVGFGGRILPSSPAAARAPKYYNSTDTPLFTKSEHLYGLDQARDAGVKAGFLAVVEGYTDVLMAHQCGVLPVVATLGTALNERHIAALKRFVPRVVLVYDADAGGSRGVASALELFVQHDIELAVAALPAGQDPCDLLVQQGKEPFVKALEQATDALEFKLEHVKRTEDLNTVSGRQRALDAVMEVLARVPDGASREQQVRRQVVMGRIATVMGVKEETLWSRLRELRTSRREPARESADPGDAAPRRAAAHPLEKELIEVLLAEPTLTPQARRLVQPHQLAHPGLRRVLAEMYALDEHGETFDVDMLRARLVDLPDLAEHLLILQASGQAHADRRSWLEDVLQRLYRRTIDPEVEDLQGRLKGQSGEGPVPIDLLRQLQEKTSRKLEV
jgi:DNA primase